MRRVPILTVLCFLAAAAPAHATTLKVVQTNVGNINGACADQAFKLCLRPVEKRAAKALRAIRPDVIGFEEILPERRCVSDPSTAPANICSSPRSPRSPVTRLLGRGYVVSCDSRFGWECLAVRRSSRAQLVSKLKTRPVVAGCTDRGFTLNTARIAVGKREVAIVLAHPDSMQVACRARQIRDVFGRVPAKGAVLGLGDFNVDPFRERDASVTALASARKRLGLRIASGRTFTLAPGRSMTDPSGTVLDSGPSTFPKPFANRTLDLVLTRRVGGRCSVRRIDGGGGMDHRAQVCSLKFP